jgi:hypothetical protein
VPPLTAALIGLVLAVLATAAGISVGVRTAGATSLTFWVDNTADGHDWHHGDGNCDSLFGGCTLQAAVEEASLHGGATVLVPAGTFTLSTQAQLRIDPGQSLVVIGAGSGRTVISGGSSTRVFDIADGADVTIDGVTISDGRVTQPGFSSHLRGAGIHNHGRLVLRNSTMYHNVVPPTADGVRWGGGAITNASTGDATLVNVTLFANTTQNGEGAGIENLGTMRITNVTVGMQWNGVAGQAAVYNAPGHTLVAEDSIFQRGPCNGQPCAGAPNCRGAITWWYSISNDQTCGFGSGYDAVDAQLGAFDTTTHVFPIPASNPAVDAGVPAAHDGRDQLGQPRPTDGDCNGNAAEDLGALEYQPPIIRMRPVCSLRPIGVVWTPPDPVLRPYP